MDKLKRQRSSIKGSITRCKTFIDQANPIVTSFAELTMKLGNLDVAWGEYKDNHRDILDLITDDLIDEVEADYIEVEGKRDEIRLKFKSVMDAVRPTPTVSSSPSTSSSDAGSGTQTDTTNSRVVADIKLPRMDLPCFNGNQLEWQSFRDLFTSVIHNNAKISPSQKLHYLKNSLKDESKDLLRSIDITDANYQIAWDLLVGRYENKRQLIHCHLQALLSQQKMQDESATQIRDLLDTTVQHARAIKALGFDTDSWDPILVFVMVHRLDPETRRLWELSSCTKSVPDLGDLKNFMEQRYRALDATSTSKTKVQKLLNGQRHGGTKVHQVSAKGICPVCKESHFISSCPTIQGLQPKERAELVKKMKLCFNCLGATHTVKDCKSKYRCKECKGSHHTLLHREDMQKKSHANADQPTTTVNLHGRQPTGLSSNCQDFDKSQVLLATAVVKGKDRHGNLQSCRALFDSGSQATLITSSCMKRLGLLKKNISTNIEGIGEAKVGRPQGIVNLSVITDVGLSMNFVAFILDKVTSELPTSSIQIKDWQFLKHLTLADPTFNKPGPIDILIGADYYEDVVTTQRIVNPHGIPNARSTVFGWILSGPIKSTHIHLSTVLSHVSTMEISDELKRFWELEELSQQQHHLTLEEQQCESHFQSTYTRDNTGRFTVSLPFKEDSKPLGQSRDICVQRLLQVERRLGKSEKYKLQYQDFMDKYLQLGHMEKVEPDDIVSHHVNYLPHHFVLKPTSTTTDFRVVFDASAKTSNGVSLNDNLLIGPRLQEDMYDILLRFRLFRYVFTADIGKMFRQIRVSKIDAEYQRILWRSHPSSEIEEYRLTTVTYGTASAPYLAVKTVQQLAADDGEKYPLAKALIKSSFYVDDVAAGNNSLKVTLDMQSQLLELLASGGFELRKWTSNHPALLERLPIEYRETNVSLAMDSDDSIKTLGLHWNPSGDFFFFKVNLPAEPKTVSKRTILSETARLFDPLGWLAPVIILAKIQLQQLWLTGVSWDDELSPGVQESWCNLRSQLFKLEDLRIRREVTGEDDEVHQLHGFCDASEQAYAAAIFLRSTKSNGVTTVNLLTSKTKVAPIKQVTLPRLELCGAVLLARLLKKIENSLHLKFESIHAWSDSTITLAWISGLPNRWKTFVANRVAEIQSLVDPCNWRYVPSADNPADCASRGLLPESLINFSLWWTGPEWLSTDVSNWPVLPFISRENLPDTKPMNLLMAQTSTAWNLIEKFSTLNKLVRTTAYCMRFIRNLKEKIKSSNSTVKPAPLTVSELNGALIIFIKQVQRQAFPEIIAGLLKKDVNHHHNLLSLDPFIDDQGVLRVGGRLKLSNQPFNQKHPILLPKNHHLTRLIVINEHIRHLHGGPQLVMAALQKKYWIVNARSLIRQLIHKCVICVKDRAVTLQQQMGNLPCHRLEATRPFLKTGVDYAGPFTIKSTKGRGGKLHKGYISLFVCFSSKAVHLEFVSDLTTDTFIAALRRFVGRRGRPSDVFSDHGSNFVGADVELKKLLNFLKSDGFNRVVSDSFSQDGINWHFIPPTAPHFGGLWEAAVKSTKRHLRKVIGTQTLTFEEMTTMLTQVEACLNSRPICPMTSDPNDLEVLTPGHFLIGDSLTAVADPSLDHLPQNRLSRWQLVQQMSQHFWRRWQQEYLAQQQQRLKWKIKHPNVRVGDLVFIKEDNLPPQNWKMGRIIEVHPGKDNLVRAVTLKTSTGILKRPIVKLCLLPNNDI